jgi:hypothetical protein
MTGQTDDTIRRSSQLNLQPGQDWMATVRQSGTPQFATNFAADAVLHASVLREPCAGVEAIETLLGVGTGGMYHTLVFTHETIDGPKTYLEWEGKAFGKSVGGSTILTRNGAGLIQSIQIYHRPLSMVLQFSAELEDRLKGKVPSNLFAAGDRQSG